MVKKYVCIPRSFLVINVSNQGKILCSPCTLYKESVRTAQKTLSTTVTKKNKQLIMYKAKVAVCFEIRTKVNAKPAPCRIS